MIHGKAASVGCLAMGDEAAADLFVLAAESGIENIKLILSPADLRRGVVSPAADAPVWVNALYEQLARELSALP
jgi:hypothetical protein